MLWEFTMIIKASVERRLWKKQLKEKKLAERKAKRLAKEGS